MINGVLFHGSPQRLTVIEPAPSRLLRGAEVVYATPSRWLALVFAAHTTDADLEFGFRNGEPYIKEMRENAFDLLKKPGFIHTIQAFGFHSDSRLGMRNHEFITNTEKPVVECESVPNLFDDLLRFPNLRLEYKTSAGDEKIK
jgi:hypothetical protein